MYSKNDASAKGGAIYLSDSSFQSIYMERVEFISNMGTLSGGAVYVGAHVASTAESSPPMVVIEECSFVANRCPGLLTSDNSGQGGAIWTESMNRWSISNTNIQDNSVQCAGGGLYITGDVTNTSWNSVFIVNNSASSNILACQSSSSGGVYIAGGLVRTAIENVTFHKNSAELDGALLVGAISSHLSVRQCHWTNNTSVNTHSDYMSSVSRFLSLEDSTFSNCSWKYNSGPGFTGGLATRSTFTHCSWEYNICENTHHNSDFTVNGCGLNMHLTDSIVEDSKVSNNVINSLSQAHNGFGAGWYGDNVAIDSAVKRVTFSNNRVTGRFSSSSGGGFFTWDGVDYQSTRNWNFVNCLFEDNSAGQAGALYAHNNNWNVYFTNTIFSRNTAESIGGAICAFQRAKRWHITNCSFDDNSSGDYGGAIAFAGSSNDMEILGTTFSGNSALSSHGGAIYGSSDTVLLATESQFLDNFAKENGGDVYMSSSSILSLDSTRFSSSTAFTGGSIRLESGSYFSADDTRWTNVSAVRAGGLLSGYDITVDITACDISYLSATQGGAIDLEASQLTIKDTVFTNCTANTGGAVSVQDCSVLMADSKFSGNLAQSSGGALYNSDSVGGVTTVSVTRCDFEYNDAKLDGGALFLQYVDIILTGSSFLENSAIISGAVTFIESSVTVTDSTFENNTASTGRGGVISSVSSGLSDPLVVKRCSFIENYASQGGGVFISSAIGTSASYASIDDSVFRANTAQNNGGAVSINRDTRVRVALSNITSNAALNGNGGAIYLELDAELTVVSSDIFLNEAVRGGGGVVFWNVRPSNDQSGVQDIEPKFENCTLEGNAAAYQNVVGFATGIYRIESPAVSCAGISGALVGDCENTIDSYPSSCPPANYGSKHLLITAVDKYGSVMCGQTLLGDVTAKFAGSSAVTVAPYVNAWADFTNESMKVSDGVNGELVVYIEDRATALNTTVKMNVVNCPDHSTCTVGVDVLVNEGYWLPDDWQAWSNGDIANNLASQCPGSGSICSGGDQTGDASCECDGCEGVLCMECASGYFKPSTTSVCTKCDNLSVWYIPVVMIIILGALVYALWLVHYHFVKQNRNFEFWYKQMRLYAKLVLIYAQISTGFTEIFSVVYPESTSTGLSFLGWVGLDTSYYGFQCVFPGLNFYWELLFVTISPFVIILICASYYTIKAYRSDLLHRDHERNTSDGLYMESWDRFVEWVKFVLIISYGRTCTVIFQVFSKDDVYDRLRADYSISTDTSIYQNYRAYAIAMLFVYPLGVPLLLFALLWSRRALVNPDPVAFLNNLVVLTGKNDDCNETYLSPQMSTKDATSARITSGDRETISSERTISRVGTFRGQDVLMDNKILDSGRNNVVFNTTLLQMLSGAQGTVYKTAARSIQDTMIHDWRTGQSGIKLVLSQVEHFRPCMYFMEIVDLVRRVMLGGLLVFIFPGTEDQIYVAMFFVVFYLVLYAYVMPYMMSPFNFTIILLHVGLIVQLLVVLIVYYEVDHFSTETNVTLMTFAAFLLPTCFPLFVYGSQHYEAETRKEENKSNIATSDVDGQSREVQETCVDSTLPKAKVRTLSSTGSRTNSVENPIFGDMTMRGTIHQ